MNPSGPVVQPVKWSRSRWPTETLLHNPTVGRTTQHVARAPGNGFPHTAANAAGQALPGSRPTETLKTWQALFPPSGVDGWPPSPAGGPTSQSKSRAATARSRSGGKKRKRSSAPSARGEDPTRPGPGPTRVTSQLHVHSRGFGARSHFRSRLGGVKPAHLTAPLIFKGCLNVLRSKKLD